MNFVELRKFVKDWKWALFLVFICLAGIPLTTIYGIQSVTWGNDFWPNALSEFLGMFVDLIFGALFTFVVIDKYIQYHKGKQWKKVKSITYKSLYFILSELLLKLNLSLQKEMRVKSYIVAEDIETLNDYIPKSDFNDFIEALINNINKRLNDEACYNSINSGEQAFFIDEQLYESLIKFKKHSKQDINNLSNLSITKLLTLSDDMDLLDELIELEELLTSLLSKIKNISDKDNRDAFKINCIWLLKLQEILTKILHISNLIKNDINLD